MVNKTLNTHELKNKKMPLNTTNTFSKTCMLIVPSQLSAPGVGENLLSGLASQLLRQGFHSLPFPIPHDGLTRHHSTQGCGASASADIRLDAGSGIGEVAFGDED